MGSTVRVICCQSFHSPQRDIYRRCIEKERREVEVQSRSEHGKRSTEERHRRYHLRIRAEKQKTGTEDVIRTKEIRTYQKDLHIRMIYYGPNTETG